MRSGDAAAMQKPGIRVTGVLPGQVRDGEDGAWNYAKIRGRQIMYLGIIRSELGLFPQNRALMGNF
jgi:hypothetical protein